MKLICNLRKVFSLTVALLCLPLLAGAEELAALDTDATLSLASVWQTSVDRNPKQQVLRAENVAVEARQRYASSALPAAPALIGLHQDDVGRGHLNEWEAGLELPIWLPGQRAAREAVAQVAGSGLEASRAALRLFVAGLVREAVWDVVMNGTVVALARQRQETAAALQRDVERRHQAGELAKTDVMLARNETLQAQTWLLRAQAELKHAEHRYWMLTGLHRFPGRYEEPLSTANALDAQHPLLAEAAQRVTLAEEERNLTRAQRRENPQVMLNARHERGAFDTEYNDSVGVAVRIPLESEGRSAPLLASAEMAIAQAASERDQLMLTLTTAMHEAEHNLEVTRAELEILEEQNRLMQENLRLARKAFSLGESDLVSLLRVQALTHEAERSLASKKIQLQWDIARYNQAMGVLPNAQ